VTCHPPVLANWPIDDGNDNGDAYWPITLNTDSLMTMAWPVLRFIYGVIPIDIDLLWLLTGVIGNVTCSVIPLLVIVLLAIIVIGSNIIDLVYSIIYSSLLWPVNNSND